MATWDGHPKCQHGLNNINQRWERRGLWELRLFQRHPRDSNPSCPGPSKFISVGIPQELSGNPQPASIMLHCCSFRFMGRTFTHVLKPHCVVTFCSFPLERLRRNSSVPTLHCTNCADKVRSALQSGNQNLATVLYSCASNLTCITHSPCKHKAKQMT